MIAWMGQRNFFAYDGAVREIPCEVSDRLFANINLSQRDKIFAVTNQMFGEILWMYPSASSTENDRFVCWSYRKNIWSGGTVSRTGGVDRGVFTYPIYIDPSGKVFDHESGFDYGDEVLPYAESGPVEMPPAGELVYMVRHLIPDEATQGGVVATFKTRIYPNGPETSHGPYSMTSPTPVRFVGRQITLKIQGTGDMDWRWGNPRIDVAAGGRR